MPGMTRPQLRNGVAQVLSLIVALGLAWVSPKVFTGLVQGASTFGRQARNLDGLAASTPSQVPMRAYTSGPVVKDPPEDLLSIKQRHLVPSAEHMEYAVVEYSRRQHMVVEGGMYETYFIRAVPGSRLRLNRVLLLKQKDENGEFVVSVGQPFVDGAYAEITILEHLKSDDIEVFKHKKKKHYMKRYIVQQKLTRFRIDKIIKGPDDAPLEGERLWPVRQTELPTE
eukprot:TRINITY_DN36535_c0_g1_i1.p1 TRINITY_DN36535_c0_g1~~TRINITY_DN36535_c0_g1_i1.p1  ORF type:complete len:226 (-),score=44.00 TRINITY_DN36535_c0_g1_i1:92-769(-)